MAVSGFLANPQTEINPLAVYINDQNGGKIVRSGLNGLDYETNLKIGDPTGYYSLLQQQLSRGGGNVIEDNGKAYYSNLNPFKSAIFLNYDPNQMFGDKTAAQYYASINTPLPNTQVDGQYRYDPSLAPNPSDLLLNPGLQDSIKRNNEISTYQSYLDSIFNKGGDNVTPSIAKGQSGISDPYAYLMPFINPTGSGSSPVAVQPSISAVPQVSATQLPSQMLSEIFKQSQPIYDELISGISAPRTTDDIRRQLEDQLLSQQEKEINQRLNEDIATTKLDFYDRGLSDAGRGSDIESNALAQLRSGSANTLASLRAQSALARLGQIEQRDTADRQARAQAQSARLAQFADLMSKGAIADTDLQKFLTGEAGTTSRFNAEQSGLTARFNAEQKAANERAYAELLSKAFLQDQILTSQSSQEEKNRQQQLELALLEDQYNRSALEAKQRMLDQELSLQAKLKREEQDIANSWETAFKTSVQTGIGSFLGGFGTTVGNRTGNAVGSGRQKAP